MIDASAILHNGPTKTGIVIDGIKCDELLIRDINSRECGFEFCWIADYPAGVKWLENKFR